MSLKEEWDESLRILERRDSDGNCIFSEAFGPEEEQVHPYRAAQVAANQRRRAEETEDFERFPPANLDWGIKRRTPAELAADQKAFRLKKMALQQAWTSQDEKPKLQPKSARVSPTPATDTLPVTVATPLLPPSVVTAADVRMDIQQPIASTSKLDNPLPPTASSFQPVPPPIASSTLPTPADVVIRTRPAAKRPRPTSKVDLTLTDDSDDDMIILSDVGIVPLPGPARPRAAVATLRQSKQVVEVSKETRGRKTGVKRANAGGGAPKAKKVKAAPTLADLIAARKKTKAVERLSFSSIDEYKVYLNGAPTPPNLVFSSSRIVLLNFSPDLASCLTPFAMSWVDLVATKGGHLVPAREFVAPPLDLELGDDWSRGTAGEKSILERAEREGWTTHIVIITPSFASSANPPPATFEAVLARLGRDGFTMDSLGKFVKIVQTTWLSGSGAEVVSCSELGHELFLGDRRSEVVDEAEERVRRSRRKKKEKSVALDRAREEEHDTSDNDGSDAESIVSEWNEPTDFIEGEEGPPRYFVTTSIAPTISAPSDADAIYNEHNYPHRVNFKDIAEEIRAIEDLNSAGEDNDSTRSSDSDDNGSKPSRKLKRVKISRDPKELGMQSGRFQCELPSLQGSKKAGPNEHIAKIYDELGKFNEEDPWRSMAYRKCSAALRRHQRPIKTVKDAEGIFGVGDKSLQRLEVILRTGTHPRLTMDVGRQESIKLFTSIYGVGTRTASKWYDVLKLRTIKDVRAKINLNAGQLLGLEYFLDLQKRIPRSEVTELFSHVQRAAARVHPGLQVECMGSYRRGQPDCGDIDILVTLDYRKHKQDHRGMISKLIQYLHDDDVIRHELSLSDDPEALDLTFHGLCSLPGEGHMMRRMDILGVPFDDLPAALIYFTGNDIFNRSLRLKARKMGYSLNQIALTKNVTRHKAGGPLGNQRSNEGQRVPGIKTEADIFRHLGVTMRPPHERQP